MKDMKRKFALILAIVFMLSLSVAFAERQIRIYKDEFIPDSGGRWYSNDTSLKAYTGIDGVHTFGEESGRSVSTCLVSSSSSKTAVTYEYSILPGERRRLPFKSGHGDAGQEYRLYMRSSYFADEGFSVKGSWSSDHKDQ